MSLYTFCADCDGTAFISPSLPLTQPRLHSFAIRYRPGYTRSHHVSTLRRARMCAGEEKNEGEGEGGMGTWFDMELLRKRMGELNDNGDDYGDGTTSEGRVIDLSDLMGKELSEDEGREFTQQFAKLTTLWVIIFTNASDGSDGVYSLTVAEDNIVLAFETKDEAQRYALCLEAQDFPRPQICELDSSELQKFCADSDMRLGFVPTGSLITPPEESAIDDIDTWRGEPGSSHATKDSTGLSEEDLDTMRKRFDTLFGK